MRNKLGAAALATTLAFGIGTPAFAQTSGGGTDQAQTTNENDDSGKLGLLGLTGLLGLAGLARRDRERDRNDYRTASH